MELVILTGMSGAGRSTALHSFEDMDYFCVDNMPPALIPELLKSLEANGEVDKIAVAVDTRAGRMFEDIYSVIDNLKEQKQHFDLVFIDAGLNTLVGRFDYTRRTHPLKDEGITLEQAIEKERELLKPLKAMADMTVDTDRISPRQLSATIRTLYGDGGYTKPVVTIVSFGFKNGVPLDADIIFDMRFLPNPYYVESMKTKTGQDKEVSDYVMNSEGARSFFELVTEQLLLTLPMFMKENKTEVTIGIGCTGGQHRSVAFAEALCARLREDEEQSVSIVHRDMEKSRSEELKKLASK